KEAFCMSDLVTPPRIPTAILYFFATQPDFPVLAGDMHEEFQQRARRSGTATANIWFWREVFRNAWALTLRELMRTPARIAAIAFGCATLVNLTPGLSSFLVANLNARLPFSPYRQWILMV